MASLSLITSLSHCGLFWRGSWVRRGSEAGKSRSAWYGGDFWVFWVQISMVWSAACLSFFRHGLRHGFLSTSAGKPSCTTHGSARLSARNEPHREMQDWAIQWSFSTSPKMKAPAEVPDRNLGIFVCGFCWLMCFWLIYEVLGVWVDGLLLDFVWMISGFLKIFNGLFLEPRQKWMLRWKLQIEI